MKQLLLRSALACGVLLSSSSLVAADAINGMWKTGDDVLVKISNCGGSHCVDVANGEYVGKRSGKLKADGGGVYTGTLKQFSTGLSFKGTATVSGNTIKLVAKKFGITVKRDTWKRQ